MATDKPITGFAPLAAVNVHPDDVLVIVDIHDTSQSSSGATKTITIADLLDNPNSGSVGGEFVGTVTGDVDSPQVQVGTLTGSGVAPAGAKLGSWGTGGTITITGSTVAGKILILTGSSPLTGSIVRVTFATPLLAIPQSVVLTPINDDAGSVLALFVEACPVVQSTDYFDLYIGSIALSATTKYAWNYAVFGQ